MKDHRLRRLRHPAGIAVAILAAAPAFAAPAAERAHEVPATNDWGLFVMVLMILTASTAALYGGGFLQRAMIEGYGGRSDRPERSRSKRRRTKRAKRRPTFDRQDRQNRSMTRIRAVGRHVGRSSQSKKRRDGPGIRG